MSRHYLGGCKPSLIFLGYGAAETTPLQSQHLDPAFACHGADAASLQRRSGIL